MHYQHLSLPSSTMNSLLVVISILLVFVFVSSHASHTVIRTEYIPETAATEAQVLKYSKTTLFFLEKDLQPAGNKMTLQYTPTPSSQKIFPWNGRQREGRDAISAPFTSTKFPDFLNQLSINPNSEEAKSLKKILSLCEGPATDGESKFSATSLKSMIEFSKATIGSNNIQAVPTKVDVGRKDSIANSVTKLQQYKITSSSRLKSDNSNYKDDDDNLVVCHSQSSASAVFYCHKIRNTKGYKIRMVGEDGTKVETVAVCHTDTAGWNPNHIAFRLLALRHIFVNPGTSPICHFVDQESVVWSAKKTLKLVV